MNIKKVISSLKVAAAAIATVAFCGGCASLSEQAVNLVDHQAPLTRVTMIDGEYKTLDEYAGKHVFLIFWATWCSHSRSAIEDFDQLGNRFGMNPNFVFLAVSVDKAEDLSLLKSRIQSQDLTHIRHAFSGNDSEDETFGAYYGTVIPYVVAVDPEQNVRVVGTSVSDLENYIESLRR